MVNRWYMFIKICLVMHKWMYPQRVRVSHFGDIPYSRVHVVSCQCLVSDFVLLSVDKNPYSISVLPEWSWLGMVIHLKCSFRQFDLLQNHGCKFEWYCYQLCWIAIPYGILRNDHSIAFQNYWNNPNTSFNGMTGLIGFSLGSNFSNQGLSSGWHHVLVMATWK